MVNKYPFVSPAILAESWDKLEEKLRMISGQYNMAQIDMCDGRFVPSVTCGGDGEITVLNQIDRLCTDLGLMIEYDMMVILDWDDTMSRWMEFLSNSNSAKAIIVHLGSTEQWDTLFKIFDLSLIHI